MRFNVIANQLTAMIKLIMRNGNDKINEMNMPELSKY